MAVDEAIVLAGGRGTRLRSVVGDLLPKPLAPVAGRPFLAWILDHLAASGMRRCILATGHLAEAIERSIGARWRGMRIDYSVECSALGTGGAFAQACVSVQGDGVHVLNGDTFLRYSPAAFEAECLSKSAIIGVALAWVEDVSRYGAVSVEDGMVREFQEKGHSGPGMINAGSYFFAREAFERLSAEEPFSLETKVLVPQARAGNVAAFAETAEFIDIGVPEDFARAQALFAERA